MDTIHRVDQGPFDVGSSARVKQPGMPEATWTVTRMSRGESFSWETRVRGMHLIATHDIAPLGSGTRSLLRLEVSGLFTAILWPLMWLPIFRALKQENEGLKRRCEAIHAP